MQETTIAMFAIGAFVIVFPLFWSAIVVLISRLSGWADLARQYPADGPVAGEVFRWCSARIRFLSSYSNCLTVTVSPDGIHIQPVILFRMGHAPLLLPWDAITALDRNSSWLIASARLQITDKDARDPTTLVLYGRGLAERLEQYFLYD